MKHLQTFEKRDIKNYSKYTNVALDFIKKLTINWGSNRVDVEKVVIYKEDNKITLEIKTWNDVNKAFFNEMEKYIGDAFYRINPNSGAQLTVMYSDVDPNFLTLLDTIIERNKYNL